MTYRSVRKEFTLEIFITFSGYFLRLWERRDVKNWQQYIYEHESPTNITYEFFKNEKRSSNEFYKR